ncbi:MAG: HNH endonuclease [Caulobacter sp.]|nr:HNH endonuclease [Caulobacter sp.]
MAKGVLTIKAQPSYKDIPGVQYHFGRELLDRVRQTLNDKIIFYEPRRPSADLNSRGGRQSYISVATPIRIRPDPELADHYYCDLENYLDFVRPVRFKEGGIYYESHLRKADGSTNRGQFGHSVRIITDQEFDAIFAAGFADILPGTPLSEGPDGYDEEPLVIDRPLVELTTLKPFRDRAFRHSVRQAYGNRCAISGLAILNAKGNPEVQAAHIRPVLDNGSDSVRNGLALTGTFHWLFDQGVIAINGDMKILVADNFLPPKLKGLINESGSLNLPSDRTKWPHPAFLEHHRKTYFVG